MEGNIKNVYALTRIYDLLLWIIPVLDKFPQLSGCGLCLGKDTPD